jgi:DNA-binding PadR family transcriptional regulator
MARSRRPSAQTTAVVLALAEAPTDWRYGYELCRQLDIKPGSLYPILVRLADRGLLEATWETAPQPGRPPRHLYRLTGAGRAFASDLTSVAHTQTAAQRRSEPRWLSA